MSKAIRKEYMAWVRDFCGMYSSANLKNGSHRMSISLEWRWNLCHVNDIPEKYPAVHAETMEIVNGFKERFPDLAHRVSYQYHIGSALYLSLRVAPE